MPRKGSAEYKEARKRARHEAFISRSIYPKLVEAQRAHNEYDKRHTVGRANGPTTTRLGNKANRKYAEYNAAFDAGVARRMGEDKPKRARKANPSKTAHVPAGNANGGQFTGASNPPKGKRKMTKAQAAAALGYAPAPKRARKPKASAPQRNLLAENENRRIDRVMARPHAPTSPLARRNRDRMNQEYHAEVERDLALAMHNIDDYVRDGSWTKEEVSRARREARAMAKREHKEVPGWTPPAKQPTARAPREAKAKRTRYDIWRERYPGRPKSEYVPRAGKRTPRTKAQATVDYLDARGAYARHKARGR